MILKLLLLSCNGLTLNATIYICAFSVPRSSQFSPQSSTTDQDACEYVTHEAQGNVITYNMLYNNQLIFCVSISCIVDLEDHWDDCAPLFPQRSQEPQRPLLRLCDVVSAPRPLSHYWLVHISAARCTGVILFCEPVNGKGLRGSKEEPWPPTL